MFSKPNIFYSKFTTITSSTSKTFQDFLCTTSASASVCSSTVASQLLSSSKQSLNHGKGKTATITTLWTARLYTAVNFDTRDYAIGAENSDNTSLTPSVLRTVLMTEKMSTIWPQVDAICILIVAKAIIFKLNINGKRWRREWMHEAFYGLPEEKTRK